MSDAASGSVGQATPDEVWQALSDDRDAELVDVRTRAEWGYVGLPDVSALGRQPILVEWRVFPQMQINEGFGDEVLDRLDGKTPSRLYFICRSGARSLDAARRMAGVFAARGEDVACVNVAEGFEGDLDADGHRGTQNGWKARGLAWRQS